MDEIEIPDETFHEAEGLTTVVLPERVTAIGEQAFRTVPSLTSLTLPPKTHQPSPKTWYTLDGRRLNEAPTRPGCYIFNGKIIMK